MNLASLDPAITGTGRKGLQMVGAIKAGSAIVGFIAPQPKGLPDIRPAREAARSYFQNGGFDPQEGWKWAKPQRVAFDRLTRRGCSLGVKIPPANSNEPEFKAKFDRKDYQAFSQLIAAEPQWQTIKGRLMEIDFKDRTFEVHTAHGAMTCRFPTDYRDDRFDGLARKVIFAKVLSRPRPRQGQWKAEACESVLLAPQPQELLPESYPAGIHPPKHPMAGGFNLEEFAPSLGAEAGESLGMFLKEFEGE